MQDQPLQLPPEVLSRQYKNRNRMDQDAGALLAQGWQIQSTTATTSRRLLGCLFGLIGYWLMPKRTVYHVTYIRHPQPLTPDVSSPPPPHTENPSPPEEEEGPSGQASTV